MVSALVFGAWDADFYFLIVPEGKSSRCRFLMTVPSRGLDLQKDPLSLCPQMASSRIDMERRKRGRVG